MSKVERLPIERELKGTREELQYVIPDGAKFVVAWIDPLDDDMVQTFASNGVTYDCLDKLVMTLLRHALERK